MSQDENYSLQWRGLTLTQTKQGKELLGGLSGSVKSGEFMTIMGPSGAGKSSLLSIVTARLHRDNTSHEIGGKVTLNGKSYGRETFSKVAAFVQQDDILYGTLTVRETFQFAATLRLWQKSYQQRKSVCDKLMQRLNLVECQNVLVGNSQFKKSISGGQKKRVAIGMELLSDPQILILDEPTSGLDSHNALKVVKILTQLASIEKKLVMATLHQPSSLIFQSLDKLYLIKRGECVYNGKAKDVIGYMQRLSIKVDYRLNPADFFMLEISTLKEEQGYITPLTAQNNAKYNGAQIQGIELPDKKYSQIENNSQSAPFFTEFSMLTKRSFRNFYRTPSNQINKIFNATLLPAFLGLIFKMVARDTPEQYDLIYFYSFLAFLFMSTYFSFSMNTYDTVLMFPSQKEIVLKEVSSKLYGIGTYYYSMLLVHIPGAILPALTGGVILQLIAGMNGGSYFLYFLAIYTLSSVVGYFFGIAFGVMCKDNTMATNFLPIVLTPIISFGGLVVNPHDLPVYSSWMQYLSPVRHSIIMMFQDQLDSPNFERFKPYDLPGQFGLDDDPKHALWMMLALLFGSAVISLLVLTIKSKRT